jgi:hypothetical protein
MEAEGSLSRTFDYSIFGCAQMSWLVFRVIFLSFKFSSFQKEKVEKAWKKQDTASVKPSKSSIVTSY